MYFMPSLYYLDVYDYGTGLIINYNLKKFCDKGHPWVLPKTKNIL